MTIGKKKISIISTVHYWRLVLRSAIFVVLAISYIRYRMGLRGDIASMIENKPLLLIAIWAEFVLEMVLRFFPSKYESPGCQKQFKKNFIKSGKTDIQVPENHSIVLIALIWVVFNGIFGALHMTGIFDDEIMILLCSAYSVCDMICILFFCPFQTWFMKNKCCCECRIYNWDYAMIFTPLFFVRKNYTWSLLVLSVALMVRWEITFFLHPERFSENTNEYLSCSNCNEKLCVHKVQLKKLWDDIEKYTSERLRRLRK